MAKERLKWNSILGLMGTSENVTSWNSAPMYSLKSFDFAGAAWIDGTVMKRRWRIRKKRILQESMASSWILCPLERYISKWIIVIILSVNIFVSVQMSHFCWKLNFINVFLIYILQSEFWCICFFQSACIARICFCAFVFFHCSIITFNIIIFRT